MNNLNNLNDLKDMWGAGQLQGLCCVIPSACNHL
jgi:hypothetical protein